MRSHLASDPLDSDFDFGPGGSDFNFGALSSWSELAAEPQHAAVSDACGPGPSRRIRGSHGRRQRFRQRWPRFGRRRNLQQRLYRSI